MRQREKVCKEGTFLIVASHSQVVQPTSGLLKAKSEQITLSAHVMPKCKRREEPIAAAIGWEAGSRKHHPHYLSDPSVKVSWKKQNASGTKVLVANWNWVGVKEKEQLRNSKGSYSLSKKRWRAFVCPFTCFTRLPQRAFVPLWFPFTSHFIPSSLSLLRCFVPVSSFLFDDSRRAATWPSDQTTGAVLGCLKWWQPSCLPLNEDHIQGVLKE